MQLASATCQRAEIFYFDDCRHATATALSRIQSHDIEFGNIPQCKRNVEINEWKIVVPENFKWSNFSDPSSKFHLLRDVQNPHSQQIINHGNVWALGAMDLNKIMKSFVNAHNLASEYSSQWKTLRQGANNYLHLIAHSKSFAIFRLNFASSSGSFHLIELLTSSFKYMLDNTERILYRIRLYSELCHTVNRWIASNLFQNFVSLATTVQQLTQNQWIQCT